MPVIGQHVFNELSLFPGQRWWKIESVTTSPGLLQRISHLHFFVSWP